MQPANVLALQRSGTIAQSVTFAVFWDQPKGDWQAATEEVHQVDLDASQLAPASDASGVVGVFLGLPKDVGLLTLADHPVTAVLGARDHSRLGVLEIELPVPAPSVAYTGLQWTRVQVGLHDGDYARLASFLNDMQALAVGPGGARSGYRRTDRFGGHPAHPQPFSRGGEPRPGAPRWPGPDTPAWCWPATWTW